MTCKLNFLSAKKMLTVKWSRTTKDDMAAAIPIPSEPYANKQIGKPILPVLGIVKGGNSLIMSLVFKRYKIIVPTIINPTIAIA